MPQNRILSVFEHKIQSEKLEPTRAVYSKIRILMLTVHVWSDDFPEFLPLSNGLFAQTFAGCVGNSFPMWIHN